MNTLSQPVFVEFKEALSKAQSDPAISSIVLISGKPECFIAGADIAYVIFYFFFCLSLTTFIIFISCTITAIACFVLRGGGAGRVSGGIFFNEF